MIQQTTERSLYRKGRFLKALGKTRCYVHQGEPEAWSSGDDELIQELGIPVVSVDTSHVGKSTGRWVQGSESRLQIPDRLAIENGILAERSKIMMLHQDQDPVVRTVLGSGRVVFLHSFMTRINHRLFAQNLTPRIEHVLSPHSHAFRPGKSIWTALRDVRSAVQAGGGWLMRTDVEQFFPSTPVELPIRDLQRMVPGLSVGYLDRLERVMSPPIRDRKMQGAGLESPTRTLLQGSVIAPLMSNVVGHYGLDEPVARASLDVTMVRYADDIVIAGASEGECMRAFGILRRSAEDRGWRLHEGDKTTAPRNVLREPIEWLGKEIHGYQIKTPQEKLGEFGERILEVPADGAEIRAVANWVIDQLVMDCKRVPDDLRRMIRKRSSGHARAFWAHTAQKRKKR